MNATTKSEVMEKAKKVRLALRDLHAAYTCHPELRERIARRCAEPENEPTVGIDFHYAACLQHFRALLSELECLP